MELGAGNQSDLRDANTGFIFQLIRRLSPISRTDIVERSRLAPSTVSVITGNLQEKRLIRECGHAMSNGGRRPVLLEVDPDGGHFVVADLSGAQMRVGVINLGMQVIKQWFIPLSRKGGEESYRQVLSALQSGRQWCGEHNLSLLGLGVASPGLIRDDGMVIEADNLGWYLLPLRRRLQEALSVEDNILVENDTNAAAYGEFEFLLDRVEEGSGMYVSVDTGIGAGLVFNGELFSGARGLAGEIGHVRVRVDPDAPVCGCGRQGCLEAVAAGPAMVRDYHASGGGAEVMDLETLLARADSLDDEVALQVVVQAGAEVGRVIGGQVNILNLERVILGGLAASSQTFFDSVRSALLAVALPHFQTGLEFHRSTLGGQGGLIGVASLSLAQLFHPSASVDR